MTNRRRSYRPTVDSLDPRVLLSVGGLAPAQIKQAYSENINFYVGGRTYAATGAGQTIAIVIGGLDPSIIGDLKTFDAQFGLPDPNIRTYYFPGAQNSESVGAQTETALDVEWSHAVAPGANIMLVQAASMSYSDLTTAVNWARQQPGVSVVSMSWGAQEAATNHAYDWIFTTPAGHAGVTFIASSGDTGAWTNPQKTQVGVEWPASDPTVLSVGGTSLSVTSSGGYLGESAWSGGGGGYSKVYSEPSYQRGVQNNGVRSVPDVSYNAAPNTGVPVYNYSSGGWMVVGGTSAGAPQWAGLVALANQGRALIGLGSLDGASQTIPSLYQFSSDFRDITSGSNGFSATRGYDVATGLGTPIAVKVVGDLAFHAITSYVTYSTAQTHVGVNANVSTVPTQTNALVSLVAPALAAEVATVSTRPASQAALTSARRIGPIAVARGPAVAAIPLEPLAGGPATRRHHDLFDSALGALRDTVPALSRGLRGNRHPSRLPAWLLRGARNQAATPDSVRFL
jgi:subtilase family serine protease